jgi:uncharacterized protein (TIGR02145 family)
MSNLDGANTYYVRAYATNRVGTGYGMALSFTTLGQAPAAATRAATYITATSAALNGVINANYLSTTVTFDYGTTIIYGQTITATQSPVTGNSQTNVSVQITGLAGGTTYHFRVNSVNSVGTTNGNDMSFTTLGQAPTAITQLACCFTSTGAKLNGTINANYLPTIVSFEYGTTTGYGQTVNAIPSSVTGNSNTSVTAIISGLTPGATYYYRVKGTNSQGTTYGNQISFTTLPANNNTVTDIDGNLYNTITIGIQVWMKENLKTTKYRNGNAIPNVTDNTTWSNLTTGAYCYYDNNPSNGTTYGCLYNFYTVVDSRNLCPIGWRVPTDEEWTTLTDYLTNYGYGYEGSGNDIAKSIAAKTGWSESYTPGTIGYDQASNNSSGFTALPGSNRSNIGLFQLIGVYGYWWTSSPYLTQNGWLRLTLSDYSTVERVAGVKVYGNSVRCVKD